MIQQISRVVKLSSSDSIVNNYLENGWNLQEVVQTSDSAFAVLSSLRGNQPLGVEKYQQSKNGDSQNTEKGVE